MPLTILTSSQIRNLLLSLSRDDVISLQRNLADALREYSTGTQEQGCSASYQPQRTAITRKDGNTTMFMPASTGATTGVRIVSLEGSTATGTETPGCDVGRINHKGSSRHGQGAKVLLSVPTEEDYSRSNSRSRRSSSSSVSSNATNLNHLSLSLSRSSMDDGSGAGPDTSSLSSSTSHSPSINQHPLLSSTTTTSSSRTTAGTANSSNRIWPGPGARDTSPRGAVVLLGPDGIPFGLVSGQELTAFRTALTALMLFNKRKRVRTITVFGAGKQAYWHIRLALLLRGPDIKRVYIINRSFERAAMLLRDIYSPENTSWRGDVKFSAVSSDFIEYPRLLKESVRKADAIFCCTPSLTPLFPAEYLTSTQGRRKGRLISAIGSYKSHMAELHPDLLRHEVRPHPQHAHHHHKHAARGGVVVVDSLETCLHEAGEIIQAELGPHQLVEIGELMIVREAARLDIDDNHHSGGAGGGGERGLQRWLESGNVIYKSVGLGLMDLVTGGDVIALARQRRMGTEIDDF